MATHGADNATAMMMTTMIVMMNPPTTVTTTTTTHVYRNFVAVSRVNDDDDGDDDAAATVIKLRILVLHHCITIRLFVAVDPKDVRGVRWKIGRQCCGWSGEQEFVCPVLCVASSCCAAYSRRYAAI